MKNYISLIIFLLFTTGIFAQNKKEKAVVAAVEKLKQAMITGDKITLENIVCNLLSYGHSGGKVENKKEFVEKLVSRQSDFVTINITEQTVAVVKNTAAVRHILSATTNDNNQPGYAKLKVLLVFVKTKGNWKLLARQAVKII